ncbi:MAG: hypothetical protein KC493_10475 [Bacteriovoracaceae bacterium]|nr:hypothetical protein [Bacteriovoracaceae bacterium]
MEDHILKDQFEAAIDVFDDNEDDENLENDERALILKARALEGQDEYDDAIEVYQGLLKGKYSRLNRKTVQTLYQHGEKPIIPDGSKIGMVYYKLAQLYSKKFLETHEATDKLTKNKLRKKAFAYLKVAKAVNENSESLESIRDKLSERREYYRSLDYEASFYVYLSYISWQDHVDLKETSTGASIALLNTSSGSCTGLGRKWENSQYEFFFDACYISGKSTVSSTISALTHKQNGVPISGFFGGPGVYWKGLADNVSAGIQIPILKRSGDWDPPNSSYTVDSNNDIKIGLSIQTKWKLKYISIAAKLGKIFKNKSSTFNIATIYEF